MFVLKYRLVQGGDDTVAELVHKTMTDLSGALDDMSAVAPLAGTDGEAAVRLVHGRADEFSVDPSKVGFMGFSTSGNRRAWRLLAGSRRTPRLRRTDLCDHPWRRRDRTAGRQRPDVPRGGHRRHARAHHRLDRAVPTVAGGGLARGVPRGNARGGHGFGMRVQHLPSDTWIDRFLQWHAALE